MTNGDKGRKFLKKEEVKTGNVAGPLSGAVHYFFFFKCFLSGSLLKKYFIVTEHRVIKGTLEIWTLLLESGLK